MDAIEQKTRKLRASEVLLNIAGTLTRTTTRAALVCASATHARAEKLRISPQSSAENPESPKMTSLSSVYSRRRRATFILLKFDVNSARLTGRAGPFDMEGRDLRTRLTLMHARWMAV